MPTNKPSRSTKNKSISVNGDVRDSTVIIGDNNTVNKTTIIQKFFNIFKSDAETLEQRNRRILLGHVENAWIKGVLDASLHGAALLDLGIKPDPEAVIQYPWAIKKESTNETIPTGTSMLDIFDSIGMGRSLLILGAPGSGKTTMLLELARQLIQRAREDVTYPIPMVFNLASWTEKLTLADWLAQELNNLYSVPRKTAPDWVKGNKLLLLLDGLDEVRQESRTKCVDAINEFRKQNGLTSLAVCSRSQDYADLNAKLSFEGAIEVQPLAQGQIAEFFNRFGDEMAGLKLALEKDSALREMAETPLFLSIMLMAYRDKRDVDIWVSKDENMQHKHLFDTYIDRMYEHPRSKNATFVKQDVLHWLAWLADKMIENDQVSYLYENMQPDWIYEEDQWGQYQIFSKLIPGLIYGLINGAIFGLFGRLIGNFIYNLQGEIFGKLSGILNSEIVITLDSEPAIGLTSTLIGALVGAIFFRSVFNMIATQTSEQRGISMVDVISWDWKKIREAWISSLLFGLLLGVFNGVESTVNNGIFGLITGIKIASISQLTQGFISGFIFGAVFGLIFGVIQGLNIQQSDRLSYPGQRLEFTARNSLFITLVMGSVFGLISGLIFWLISKPVYGSVLGANFGLFMGLFFGFLIGLFLGLYYGGLALIQHHALRFVLARNNLLPWRLVPFLDHCVDLIFLRRVGGGYIFVHRLLMEHFAEMYVETPPSPPRAGRS